MVASVLASGPVVGLIALGVVIAIAGHLARSRPTVVAGIAMLFVATALLIAGAYAAYRHDPTDPRPCGAAGGCR
jgi:riboflavin transporter FmnP